VTNERTDGRTSRERNTFVVLSGLANASNKNWLPCDKDNGSSCDRMGWMPPAHGRHRLISWAQVEPCSQVMWAVCLSRRAVVGRPLQQQQVDIPSVGLCQTVIRVAWWRQMIRQARHLASLSIIADRSTSTAAAAVVVSLNNKSVISVINRSTSVIAGSQERSRRQREVRRVTERGSIVWDAEVRDVENAIWSSPRRGDARLMASVHAIQDDLDWRRPRRRRHLSSCLASRQQPSLPNNHHSWSTQTTSTSNTDKRWRRALYTQADQTEFTLLPTTFSKMTNLRWWCDHKRRQSGTYVQVDPLSSRLVQQPRSFYSIGLSQPRLIVSKLSVDRPITCSQNSQVESIIV